MANFQFLTRNQINTTTQFTVNTGASATKFMYDRTRKKFTQSFDTTTSATGTVDIVLNRSISRLILQDMNWKNFSITYNTGNSFTLINSDTSTSSWTGNSATSLYLHFATTTVNTLSIIVNSNTTGTIPSHTIEELWACDVLMEWDRNPDAKNFKTRKDRKEFTHNLAGGGTTQYILDDFYDAKIKMENITKAEADNFRAIYDQNDAVAFAPFPTGTSWDNQIYEVIWRGDFDFIQREDNDESAGYQGSLNLKETGK